jgi:hypothetical protein
MFDLLLNWTGGLRFTVLLLNWTGGLRFTVLLLNWTRDFIGSVL